MTTSAQQTVSPAIKKYLDIIESGTIQEGQIISMKSLMGKNSAAAESISNAFFGKELTISEVQTKKGLDFLLSQWKTPRGSERKNNPFEVREQTILNNFSHFTLSELHDATTNSHPYYVPVYRCYSGDGNYFEYYYDGKVNITG